MITSYHRPKTLEQALTLLSRPNSLPLGGGTLLSRPGADPMEVVDLQALGLDTIEKNGNELALGATATLQQIHDSEHCPGDLAAALKLEAPLNLRNSATAAGTIAACDGRSTFATALLAMDAKIVQAVFDRSIVGEQKSGIGEYLPLRPKHLMTRIVLPVNAKLAFEYVSRTPADKPIVCVALARWASGRARLALGGYGANPLLAFDGKLPPASTAAGVEAEGLVAAARNAFHEATDDWATAEYRMDVAGTLAKRCVEKK
jgi:CO/xanthine dehydrogenase FAD-binding subunit